MAGLIERRLFDRGYSVAIADTEEVAETLQAASLIAILNAGPEVSLPVDEQAAADHIVDLVERDSVRMAGSVPEQEKIECPF